MATTELSNVDEQRVLSEGTALGLGVGGFFAAFSRLYVWAKNYKSTKKVSEPLEELKNEFKQHCADDKVANDRIATGIEALGEKFDIFFDEFKGWRETTHDRLLTQERKNGNGKS